MRARPGAARAHAGREVNAHGRCTTHRFLRPRARQSAHQRHRPLQHPLLLLHAGDGRAVRASAREILDFEEIERFVRIAAGLGIDKLRLTGGEPLVRRDLPVLIRAPGGDPGHPRSGADHQRRAAGPSSPQPLYDAGLRRLNVHWTRSTASASAQITRRDDLPRVLAGIDAAKRAGLRDDQAQRRGGEESGGAGYRSAGALRARERLRGALHRVHAARCAGPVGPLEGAAGGRRSSRCSRARSRRWTRCPIRDPRAPATEYAYADGGGTVGFIASVSRPFCLNCNRMRLTADGKLRYCLFAIEEDDVKGLLRVGRDG